MSCENYSDLQSVLAETGILIGLFDLSRIVDAEQGVVMELEKGVLVQTKVSCNNVLGTDARCKNCSSIRAHYSKDAIVKLEYVNNSVLLIFSVPIHLYGRHLVVELVKDITKSMTVDIKDTKFQNEIPSIINQLNRVSTSDALTGLQNRRYLDENLHQSINSCSGMGKPLSIAMLDIDYFKKVNDTYGHQSGDVILKSVADIVKSFIRRESDFAVRYGGEEMLLCLPGAPLNDCLHVCERIHRHIAESIFTANGQTIRVTVSIGLAESSPQAPMDREALIALADKRLYRAKDEGRNRIVWTG